MFTITPDLDGLTLHDWVNALTAAGVNTGVIYVMPGYRLASVPVIDQKTWDAYNQYIYLPPASLNDDQKQVILEVDKAISKRNYTVAQRNEAILMFLTQLQKAFPNAPPMKFILDERAWFINHLDTTGAPISLSIQNVFPLEQAYTDDIAGIVTMAAHSGLDHWLSGVRLSEYAAKNWNLMGPVMVDLVTEINAKTSGWMKTHIFIGAGGGWGQYWNGINDMQCPATTGWQFEPCSGAFPFFKYMDQQVGYFAFGDKFMEFGKPQQYMLNGQPSGLQYTYINGQAEVFCQENTRKYACQNPAAPTVKDWQAFLGDDVDGLGFSDLIDFLSKNAQKYPHLANVIFEGDNSDSIATMTLDASSNGAVAIANMFRDAMQGRFQDMEKGSTIQGQDLGTWTGKIFLDGFDDKSTVPRPSFYGDAGYSMFDTDYNDFTFSPAHVQIMPLKNATENWSHWP